MKGIVLAGGTGSRLWPITRSISKQLLPVYDKPMIYYPISTLMLAGIRDILIITTPHEQSAFLQLLGDGSQFGVHFEYAIQPKPEGLAQAFVIAKDFLKSEDCLLVLGDNIFHGAGLGNQLQTAFSRVGAHIFTYEVANPADYGVLTLNEFGYPISIEEKPLSPKSRFAVTGLYYFDNQVSTIAHGVKKSSRGELEITAIIDWYLKKGQLNYTHLTRGLAWLDTGTPDALLNASNFVQVIEKRTGLKIGCLEEIAFQNKWISETELSFLAEKYRSNSYGEYIAKIK
jgi:glucose-1-phosphate thymidylyltransferase